MTREIFMGDTYEDGEDVTLVQVPARPEPPDKGQTHIYGSLEQGEEG